MAEGHDVAERQRLFHTALGFDCSMVLLGVTCCQVLSFQKLASSEADSLAGSMPLAADTRRLEAHSHRADYCMRCDCAVPRDELEERILFAKSDCLLDWTSSKQDEEDLSQADREHQVGVTQRTCETVVRSYSQAALEADWRQLG